MLYVTFITDIKVKAMHGNGIVHVNCDHAMEQHSRQSTERVQKEKSPCMSNEIFTSLSDFFFGLSFRMFVQVVCSIKSSDEGWRWWWLKGEEVELFL